MLGTYKFSISSGLILSTSRTGMVIGFIMVAFDIINYFKNIKKYNRLKIKYNSILTCIIIIFNRNIKDSLGLIIDNIKITLEKLLQVSSGTDSSSNMHLLYYKKSYNIFSYSNLFQILFGYGTFCNDFPYFYLLNIYTWQKTWNPESDFISVLIGNGIIGFSLYYSFVFRCIKYNINYINAVKLIVSIVIGGYIWSSWPIIILIMLFIRNEDNKFKLANIL